MTSRDGATSAIFRGIVIKLLISGIFSEDRDGRRATCHEVRHRESKKEAPAPSRGEPEEGLTCGEALSLQYRAAQAIDVRRQRVNEEIMTTGAGRS